ncbi:hypothetical protein ACP70R_002502 [Stipagrostis hirtigluma subsp. patula]
MKIAVQSSKAIKPAYGSRSGGAMPGKAEAIPLTVFDKITFDQRISSMNFFRPPAPPSAVLEAGLATALAVCRVWAGRLGVDADGNRAILLNDAGARFIEATADVALSDVMPLEPTPEVQGLHPSRYGVEELLLVQVTRFTCGSYVVGQTLHHLVGDCASMSSTMVAWGKATRGAAVEPVPVIDRRAPVFAPRNPPRVEFQHRGAEFKMPHGGKVSSCSVAGDEVVMHRVHFTSEMISELRSRASPAGAPSRPYSTVQCAVAHLWRCITAARRLDGCEATTAHVAVNGRARMRRHPRVPDEYIGNAVLWARPAAAAGQLVSLPLRRATELVSRAYRYFRSFIDFASSGAEEEEELTPTADAAKMVLSPDIDCWGSRSATSTSAPVRHCSTCAATCRRRASCSSCRRSPATEASTRTSTCSAAT